MTVAGGRGKRQRVADALPSGELDDDLDFPVVAGVGPGGVDGRDRRVAATGGAAVDALGQRLVCRPQSSVTSSGERQRVERAGGPLAGARSYTSRKLLVARLARIFPHAATATEGIEPLVTAATEARQAGTEHSSENDRPLFCPAASLFGCSPPLEIYPALAFDRLFKDEVQRGDRSVLDAVLEDATGLRRRLSTSDQRKLDEYLDSVRDVETRIANAGITSRPAGRSPPLPRAYGRKASHRPGPAWPCRFLPWD